MNLNESELLDVTRVMLERIHITTSSTMDTETLRRAKMHGPYFESFSRGMMCSLDSYLHGLLDERIVVNEKWPADWWESFKERWFFGWMLKRWPVRYESVNIDKPVFKAVCPHLQDAGENTHYEFLYHKSL